MLVTMCHITSLYRRIIPIVHYADGMALVYWPLAGVYFVDLQTRRLLSPDCDPMPWLAVSPLR